MKRICMLFAFITSLFSGKAQSDKQYPAYTGKDLGLTFVSNNASFRIWAPTATQVKLRLYSNGQGGEAVQTIAMKKAAQGTWTVALVGTHLGDYYTFSVEHKGAWLDEVPDPYAKAVGTNGKRAMIVDMQKTNPAGWATDKTPVLKSKTDAIVYELHVRDASIAANSGIKNKGKFIGLTETGTKNSERLSTGLDHLVDLGITHVQLLPLYDYNSVDEAELNKAQYNWGYDPQNYNTPDGSYSTDAANGAVRIKEFKQLVKTFHSKGLSVVMDVVYNHTGTTNESNFNQLVPGYYYRQTAEGKFSDASGCGNETASEKAMMRKYMIESVLYWVKEYHIDGFRFDLMGVHDIETMNLISKELHKIKPSIIIYGEGWTSGGSTLAEDKRAVKKNTMQLDKVGVFSDDIRDGIKGSVFEHKDGGFASGKPGMEESIKFGIVASTQHPQLDYSKVNYSKAPYAKEPYQTVTYVECHDNHVLWDRLLNSNPNNTEAEKIEMHKLALSIVLTSQGISFLHAGTEFLRTKKGVENSYKSPDDINEMDWSLKTKNKAVFDYVQGLVRMRKAHPAFRMNTTASIAANLRFINNQPAGVIGYILNGAAVNDTWKNIQVWFNGNTTPQKIKIEGSGWKTAVLNNKFAETAVGNEIALAANSCVIIYKK
jgi:pullulanase